MERLGRSIIAADIITIAIGGALSYVLAGRTLRPIRESVEAEQRFFANAAHDLRTPLAVMRAEAEVVLRAPRLDDGEARKVIASSLEEIGRMSAMVEQMMDLARRESPRSSGAAAFQPVDLAELARNLTAKMARRAADRAIRLAPDAPEPAAIRGDALALQRAVANVLENALAYTPAGGVITVGVHRHGGHVVLSVTDSGIGIPASDLPHITEPFYRGDRARAAHSGGAGLGLTIARATTEAHRGSLHAVSSPGAGTTISLRFPAA
jgi:signal transduction histidine kinase